MHQIRLVGGHMAILWCRTFGALRILDSLFFQLHSRHVTIIGNEILVTGDCLFLGSCGRTDPVGGDEEKQRQSVLYQIAPNPQS